MWLVFSWNIWMINLVILTCGFYLFYLFCFASVFAFVNSCLIHFKQSWPLNLWRSDSVWLQFPFWQTWKRVGLRQWLEFLLSPCTIWSCLPDIFHMIYQCQKDRIFGICPIEHSFFSSIYRLIYFKIALKVHWWKAYRWAETVVFNSSLRPFLHSRVKPLLNTKSKFSLA